MLHSLIGLKMNQPFSAPLLRLKDASLFLRLMCFVLLVFMAMLPKVIYNLIHTGSHFWINMGRTYSFAVLYPAAPILLYGWAKLVCQQPRPFQYYGLKANKQSLLQGLLGLTIGGIGVLGYLGFYYHQGAVSFNPHFVFSSAQVLTLVSWFAGAFGIVLIEELFFRGFIFNEAYRSYSNAAFAIVFSGLFFGFCHFKLALLLPISIMGIVLAQAKVYFNSNITFGMGLHGAWIFFFWGINMVHLLQWSAASSGVNPFNTTLVAILMCHSIILLIMQIIKNRKVP